MQAVDQLRGVAAALLDEAHEPPERATGAALMPCMHAHSEAVSRLAFDPDAPFAVVNAVFKQAVQLHEKVEAHPIAVADVCNQHALWLWARGEDDAALKRVQATKEDLLRVKQRVEKGEIEGPNQDSWDLLVCTPSAAPAACCT